ncbi:pseudouridine-5'-phosphate glycosidase [Schnuerera sp.]|uniref:pseudouridine-5'-phosphate glycosidase n=1 Tax=Schnuerera sp. TaxID=2794844 RepID=UPI002C4C9C6D|nr:pseudouridine-5'-phosphate glycosidase [Schnuerera sp.]HSH36577.1 pseudouridine-5'-phosphate glycosidase [Schnuerera sp.]
MILTDGNRPKNYLVETALLGHGLISVEDYEILSAWPKGAMLAWMEKGKIRIGTIEEFIPGRQERDSWTRLDGRKVKEECNTNINAYLTASGTMAVAKEIGCPVVVSAGIGGIGDIKEERLCYDLPALSQMDITLVATSPKDMLDMEGTLNWLKDHGVNILGFETEYCDGYILSLKPYRLLKKLSYEDANQLEYGCNLVLNPIPKDHRLKDGSFLEEAIRAGKEAEEKGQHYHPAANACFDRLSFGLSSKIQLESLISNIKLAEIITENR